MKQPERQPDRSQEPFLASRYSLAVAALVAAISQLVSGCVAQVPQASRQIRSSPVQSLDMPTVVLRGGAPEPHPTDRQRTDYQRERTWELQRRVRILSLEMEIYQDQLKRLVHENADEQTLDGVREEIRWRMGAMSSLLCEPDMDNTGF